jgi:hypothetical protein
MDTEQRQEVVVVAAVLSRIKPVFPSGNVLPEGFVFVVAIKYFSDRWEC